MPKLLSKATRPALALLALAGLAGCTPPDKFPPLCPQLAILQDAADLTRYNGRGTDITDLDLDVRLAAVPAACSQSVKGIVHADLSAGFDMLRGPARRDRRASIGWFVAVTDAAGKLLDKQTFRLDAEFPPNTDRVAATSEPVGLDFPVSDRMASSDYRIYVGLVLTPEEVASNRRRAGKP